MNKIKAIYIGYDIETFLQINKDERYALIGTVVIDDLLNYKTYNLIDYIYKTVYRHAINSRCKKLSRFYLRIFNQFAIFASPVYRKYQRYLNCIISNEISIFKQDDLISHLDIDVIIVNNWWLLPAHILQLPKYGCINIHPSCLPQYRGAVPTLWSLKNGDTYSAVSYMILEEKMDAGMILSQYQFEICAHEDSLAIENKIEKIVANTLLNDIQRYLRGELNVQAQNNSHASTTARYYEYMRINFVQETAVDIVNKIRLYPYLTPIDLCYFKFNNGKIIKFKNASLSHRYIDTNTCEYGGNYMFIGCKKHHKSDANAIKILLFKDVNFWDSIYLLINKLT